MPRVKTKKPIDVEFIDVDDLEIMSTPKDLSQVKQVPTIPSPVKQIVFCTGKGLWVVTNFTIKVAYKTFVAATPIVIKAMELFADLLFKAIEGSFKMIGAGIKSAVNSKPEFYYYRNQEQVDNYVPSKDAHIAFHNRDLERRFYEKHSPRDPRDLRRTRWD